AIVSGNNPSDAMCALVSSLLRWSMHRPERTSLRRLGSSTGRAGSLAARHARLLACVLVHLSRARRDPLLRTRPCPPRPGAPLVPPNADAVSPVWELGGPREPGYARRRGPGGAGARRGCARGRPPRAPSLPRSVRRGAGGAAQPDGRRGRMSGRVRAGARARPRVPRAGAVRALDDADRTQPCPQPAGVPAGAKRAVARAMMCERGAGGESASPDLFAMPEPAAAPPHKRAAGRRAPGAAASAAPDAAKPRDEACGACAACGKSAGLQHPDLRFLFPVSGEEKELETTVAETLAAVRSDPLFVFTYEKAASIRLSLTRELLRELAYKPFEAARR